MPFQKGRRGKRKKREEIRGAARKRREKRIIPESQEPSSTKPFNVYLWCVYNVYCVCHAFLDVLFSYERETLVQLRWTTRRKRRESENVRHECKRSRSDGRDLLRVFSRASYRLRPVLVAYTRADGCAYERRRPRAIPRGEADRKRAGNHQSVKGTTMEHDCAIRKPVPYALRSGGLVKNSIDRPPLT